MARASKHRLGLVQRWQVPTLCGAVLAAGAWASIQLLMVAQVLDPVVFQPISSLAQLRMEVLPHRLLPSAQEFVELPLRQFHISLNAAMLSQQVQLCVNVSGALLRSLTPVFVLLSILPSDRRAVPATRTVFFIFAFIQLCLTALTVLMLIRPARSGRPFPSCQ